MKTFLKNLENIEAHNKRNNETYKRRLQVHSDLTFKEKKVYRMGVKINKIQPETIRLNTTTPHNAPHGNFIKYFNKFFKFQLFKAIVNHTKLFAPIKGKFFLIFFLLKNVQYESFRSRLLWEVDNLLNDLKKIFITQFSSFCSLKSCYAFSTVSVLEYMARKAGRKNLYSEQDIIDCDRGNEGCDGGNLHCNH